MFNPKSKNHKRSRSSTSFNANSDSDNERTPQIPSWGRSKSSESISHHTINTSNARSNPFAKKFNHQKSSNSSSRSGGIYNLSRSLSQSLDALPIMEDDESEQVLSVPVLPMFKKNKNTPAGNTTQSSHPKPANQMSPLHEVTSAPQDRKRKPYFHFGSADTLSALNVNEISANRHRKNKNNKKNSTDKTHNINNTLFDFKMNNEESEIESDVEEDEPDSDDHKERALEKHEIDEDFNANWARSDKRPSALKRKPQALERKLRFLSNEPSSDDDDTSTDHSSVRSEKIELNRAEEEPKISNDTSGETAIDDSYYSDKAEADEKNGFLKTIFRSRTRSNASKPDPNDIDLELGHSIEKVQSTPSTNNSVKSQGFLNKIFNIEGFINGGGLTPSNNITNEPYAGIEEEKKQADFIVQQAMTGLHRPEPELTTVQLGDGPNHNGKTTSMNDHQSFAEANLTHRKHDSELYLPNDFQDNEFDNLQNFDDFSIDVPSLKDVGKRRKRAGIGSLLMKLHNDQNSSMNMLGSGAASLQTTLNNAADSSFSSINGYSNYNTSDDYDDSNETDLVDMATANLKDILSVHDFESHTGKSQNDYSEFDKITNNTRSFESSIDGFESKTQLLLNKTKNPANSIRNFIMNEGGKSNINRRNHKRNKSNLPDFNFKKEEQQKHKKKKLFKRKKENAARITVHIADLLARQRFILLLCKAFMLYGAPTHRLEEYMAMTANVLEVDGSFVYFPGTMIVSFSDAAMRTSEMRLVRCSQGLDLSKLDEAHDVYKGVVHDRLGVEDGCRIIDELIKRKPKYNKWICVFYYAFSSACVCSWSFGGSWIDMPISFGVGAVIGFLQFVICPMNNLYSSVFEVCSSIVASFLARAIGSINGGNTFCYASIVQSSLALILPGYIILCGSLELQSRNLVAGSVRMFYAFIYSLMLSFGITLGAALYGWIDHDATSNTQCTSDVSPWFRFLFIPLFTIGIALCNQASWKQLPMMVVVSSAGYVVTYFSSLHFKNVTELNATLGCFILGLVANIYSRMHKQLLKKFKNFGFGTSMTVSLMLPGIFVQVPSGIASQGSVFVGINTANSIVNSSNTNNDPTSNSSSLAFGMTMIQVALGISIGLYLSTIVVYPFGKKKTGLFTLG